MAIFPALVALRQAIDAYRAEDKLDRWALALLDRLARSRNAANAFERLNLKDRSAEAHILKGCVTAEQLARMFPTLQKELERLERAGKEVAGARAFVAEEIKQLAPGADLLRTKPWNVQLYEGDSVAVEAQFGLGVLSEVIAQRQRQIKLMLIKAAPTRKQHQKEAAHSAAIWHLAMMVQQVLAKPHVQEVADLASVILRTRVFATRVRGAVRRRQERWQRAGTLVR